MIKAVKIRLYPNKTQEIYISKLLGCYRFVYNQCLDKKIKAFEDLQKAQKEASIAGKQSGTSTPNTPRIVSSIGTEEEVKSNIAEIDARALLTRQDELKTIKEKLNVLGTGITLDGKDLSSQVQSLTVKKEQLEVAREISSLNENNTVISAVYRCFTR